MGESQPAPRTGKRQQRVIARVPPGGDAEIETRCTELAAHAGECAPRPTVQAIFPTKGRPRRDERHELNLRRETCQQRRGVRLREQGDVRMARRGPQKRRGEREVAKAPKFDGEQA